eukprot:2833321-Pleurochrysis_carterae.AAC.2
MTSSRDAVQQASRPHRDRPCRGESAGASAWRLGDEAGNKTRCLSAPGVHSLSSARSLCLKFSITAKNWQLPLAGTLRSEMGH